MASSDRSFMNDLSDLPVGLGRNRFPTSGAPIEQAGPDGLALRLDQPRNCRRLPSTVRLSVKIGQDVLWNEVRIAPEVFLDELARKLRLLFKDPSPPVEIGEASTQPPSGSITVKRDGVTLVLSATGKNRPSHFRVAFGPALDALEEFGHAIAIRLPAECASVKAWRNRLPRDREGMATWDAELLDLPLTVAQSLNFEPIDDPRDLAFPNDLRMAARLAYASDIKVTALREALDEIRAHGPVQTTELDGFAERASDGLSATLLSDMRPWEKGHALALWLRKQLGVAEGRFDIEGLLRAWGVSIREIDLATPHIDAIAAWGDHGPVIVVNRSGTRSHSPTGQRATLAHELCHLLIDRSGALPVAEAQGDRVRTMPDIEKRANAFAAELLLPREDAGRVLRQWGYVQKAVDVLMERFDVSRVMTLRQLGNHPFDAGGPTTEQRAEIKRLIDDESRIASVRMV